MTTTYHAKYWAHRLLLASPQDEVEGLSRAISNSRVDLNPHQIDAALFALRSPYSKGALLADEVGLGKTIEAGLILSQRWAERRRRILLIVPATLRKQWQMELEEKFYLPSVILEAKSFNEAIKKGSDNPFVRDERIVLCSYQFVYTKRDLVKQVPWDLVVIDEAHRLRNIFKGTKTAEGIVDAIRPAHKLLLTATPLQNSLLELYGLVGIVDPELFGSMEAFQDQYMNSDDAEARDTALRERIQNVCKRTLRRQVLEYIKFTERFAHTADFVPSDDEERLYNEVSEYLQREVLVALPNARRKLITLVLRKLLASSSAAIGATLAKFADRLRQAQLVLPEVAEDALAEDFESLDEVKEEWDGEDDEPPTSADPAAAASELATLERFVALAKSIPRDAKAAKLLDALPVAFDAAEGKDAPRKAVIFTESCKTQEYLFQLLSEHGYRDQIVLMNGSNSDPVSRQIYADWKKRNEHRWREVSSGSRTADMKAAIVEEFRDRKALLLATESAAEGVNLQFCAIVVNYDLPWNPQRIEQRIGRCHRYGQRSDVLVVNFLNRKNAADQRVFEILSQKFQLFEGVFGASDEVLGAVESGVDLEKSIAAIYQESRSTEEIQAAFDRLQEELDEKIQAGIERARRAFLENFDAEVHERLRMHREAAKQSLDARQQLLLDLAKHALSGQAVFDAAEPAFAIEDSSGVRRFHMAWQAAEERGATFFRADHPVAERIIRDSLGAATPLAEVALDYSSHASALEPYRNRAGWLRIAKLTTVSLGRTEEHLLAAGCDAEGHHLRPDVAEKLLTLNGVVAKLLDEKAPPVIDQIIDELKGYRLADVQARNETFFQEEAEKLERRSEDLKVGLEREIKKLDKEIATLRREGRQSRGLEEQLAMQKRLRVLEDRRKEKRRQYYDEQDHIDADQKAFIEQMEAQLRDKRVDLQDLFTIRWTLR
jgi:adenine-specific DNA-methyltransferase